MRRVPPVVPVALVLSLAASMAPPLAAQERSLAQDPTLDNLVHRPGTVTAPWETLGEVRRGGTGERTLLFLPGIGFGADVWTEVAERHRDAFRTLAVTLPGFGGTPPYPMPDGAPRFSDTPWIRSAEAALAKLLDAEAPRQVTLVAQWALGTQLALRLALDHPDRVDGVILAGGVLKAYYEGPQKMDTWNVEQRARFADGMGEHWFKTVTRTTWDDNNYMSYDYAIHPRRGLFLWRQAAAPALPVWIRWLLEFYALDSEPELAKLTVPVLVVQPGFDDPAFLVEPGRNYMRNLCLDSWKTAREAAGTPAAPTLRFTTIPQARLFLQYDQPEAFDRTLDAFLAEVGKAK